jgi:hypothetical protein
VHSVYIYAQWPRGIFHPDRRELGLGKTAMADPPTVDAHDSDSDASSRKNHVNNPADPDDFGSLEDALNEAAKRANAAWLALVATLSYFLVAAIKITHKDLS